MDDGKSLRSEKPEALTDWAYQRIKELILNLKIKPGSQVQIESMAQEFQTSRTPVREALLRLQKDGLVQAFPRVGFFVADLTATDLDGLMEVREWLESNAAGKVASTIREADLAVLDRLMADTALAVRNKDREKFLELEEAFHNIIISLCGNKYLLGVMDGLNNLVRRERVLSIRSSANIEMSYLEHENVVSTLHERNPARVAEAMANHIRAARERLRSTMEEPAASQEQGE